MGLLNKIKSIFGKGDIIAKALKLLDEKVNAKNLATIFSTYLLISKNESNYTDASKNADSFVQKVASFVNLNDCADYKEVISKLASNNEESAELANQLKKAVALIRSIG